MLKFIKSQALKGTLINNAIQTAAFSGIALATMPDPYKMNSIVLILGLGAGTSVYSALADLRKKKKEETVAPIQEVKNLSDGIYTALEELEGISREHTAAKTEIASEIEIILNNAVEFFKRINDKQSSQSRDMAAIKYEDIFKKLIKALHRDYYLDILKHPTLWDNPENRIDAVNNAVKASSLQLVKNIKQINASQDIEIELSLESLKLETA